MVKIIETKEEFAAGTAGELYTTDTDSFYVSDSDSEEETTFYRVAVYDAKEKKTVFYNVSKDIFSKTADTDVETWMQGELLIPLEAANPYVSGHVYVNKMFLWENEDCFKMHFSTLKRQLHRASSGIQKPVAFLSANFEEQKETHQDDGADFYDIEDVPFGYYERVLVHDGNGNGYMQRRTEVGWRDNEVYVANIQQDYTFRFYKESGKAYMYKGKKFAFANYSTNEFNFPIRLETLLEKVPDAFLEKMNAFMLENHISVYEKEAIVRQFQIANKQDAYLSVFSDSAAVPFVPYSTADITASLLYLCYYKGMQPFAGETVISRMTGKLSRNRTINEKIRDSSSKKEVLKALSPYLTSKQVAKIKFADNFLHGSQVLFLTALMENPDQIEKVLKEKQYTLCLRELYNVMPSEIRKNKKLIAESIGIARFERLIVNGLKTPKSSANNPFPRKDISFIEDTLKYLKLIGTFTEEQKEKLVKAKDMRSLHDQLGTMVKEKKDATYAESIEYTDNERALETSNDQFRLSLAQSKKELAEVGKEMHICVGALYADGAYNKDFGIAVIWEGEKPVFCIELDEKFSCVVQAKARFNERLDYFSDKDLFDFFYDWMAEKALTVDTYDVLKEVLNERIDNKTI